MDIFSSPLAPRSSLPPSSAPDPTQSTNGRSPRRNVPDVLALGDDEAQEDETQTDAADRRRQKPRGRPAGDVPLVKDPVGESVAESFETFLKTFVSPSLVHSDWSEIT
jgi:DNA replication licensing factor MCM6